MYNGEKGVGRIFIMARRIMDKMIISQSMIASLLCCIEAREALLRGLFFGLCQNRKTERKNKHICRIGI